jgi:hypothetical protein
MILERAPSDPVASFWVAKDAIAQRYGWTFDHVENLDVETIAMIQAIMSAENRYQKRKQLESKISAKK